VRPIVEGSDPREMFRAQRAGDIEDRPG